MTWEEVVGHDKERKLLDDVIDVMVSLDPTALDGDIETVGKRLTVISPEPLPSFLEARRDLTARRAVD